MQIGTSRCAFCSRKYRSVWHRQSSAIEERELLLWEISTQVGGNIHSCWKKYSLKLEVLHKYPVSTQTRLLLTCLHTVWSGPVMSSQEMKMSPISDLQKLVLFPLVGANSWAKHAKNCLSMSTAHICYIIAHLYQSTVILAICFF